MLHFAALNQTCVIRLVNIPTIIFIKTAYIALFYENGGGDVHQSNETIQDFNLIFSDSKLQNAATTTAHLYTSLANVFEKNK